MSTKMKGLFKGLRYISQIFDEDQQKEQDFQIGLPTDVKHVAHIGWDGPGSANSTSVDSPNWMKDMGPSTGKDNGEVKWVSEDSKRAQRAKKSQEKEGEGSSKPSRRRSTDNNPLDTSPKAAKPSRRQSSDNKNAGGGGGESKPRQSRRNQAKDPSDAAAAGQDADAAPKKTRRKKSEAGDQAGQRRPKNRSAANSVDAAGADGGVQKLISDDEDREDIGRAAQMKGSLQS